jgi:3-hydroxyisobutyryl-CoA hydrolase
MEEIMHAVEAEAQQSADEWYENTLNSLKKMSPISLKVTLRSIREGRQQSLHQCLEHEYRVSVNAVNAEVSTDFYEGCRAVLVDKDNTPKVHLSCFVVCEKIRHHLPQISCSPLSDTMYG